MALSTTDKATVTSLVTSSFDSAYALLGAVARQSDATALFTRIYGGTATSTSLINSRIAGILSNLQGGLRFKFTFSVLSKDEMGTTAAAWSSAKNCFYINGDWLLTVPEAERSQRLLWLVVSQMGYAFDSVINTTNDAAGQEGALLANAVLGVVPGATQQAVLNQNQAAATITLSGVKLAVEATDPAVVPPALSQLQSAVGLSALTTNQQGLWTLAVANATGRLASLVQGGGAATVLQNLFGAAGTAAASFSASLQSQVALLTAGGLQLAVELRSAAEMNGASVAYAAAAPGGGERLYVSSALLAGSNSAEQIGWLLLKGIGQALDRRLNGSLDSRGDEGAAFAAAVAGRSLTAAEKGSIGLDATGGVLLIGGATVAVELSDAVQNRAPVLAGAGSNASFTEAAGLGSQAAGVAVFSGINLGTGASDESSQTIRSFSLSVAGLRDGAGETLLLDGSRISLGSSGSGTTTASGLSWSLSVAADTATLTFTSAAGLNTAAAAALLNGLAYQNTNTDNPSAGNRRFSLTAVQDSGGTANGGVDTTNPNLTSTINVVAVNDAPLLGSLAAVALVDTRAQDTFNATAGSLSASDPEGQALSYGLAGAGATTASFDGVSYNLSAAGAYGTLYLNSSTGQYRYQPKSDWQLNALSASGSESFTLNVSDGSSSSSQALLINFTGSVESPEQYVLVDDGAPVLTLQAQALWEQSLTNASRSLSDLLNRADRDAILADVFGRAGTDSVVFAAALNDLLASLGGSGLRIEVDLRSDAELNGALAAYAAIGHTGSERIYVNGDKLNNGQLDLTLTTSALLEEFGHAMDRRLNGEIDSPGDEGELFASQVTGVVLTADQRALIDAQVDSAVLTIEGVQVAVEEATQGSITSAALSASTTTQTLGRSAITSVDLTVTYNGQNGSGADFLVAAYNSSTLIGWTVYNRSNFTDPGNNASTTTIPLTFNLAQFNPNFSSNGLTIRAWQGTAGGATSVGTPNDTTPAVTSGSSSSVPFTPNTTTAATTDRALSGFVTNSSPGGSSSAASTSWANTGIDTTAPAAPSGFSAATLSLDAASDTGISSSDRITSNTTPTLTTSSLNGIAMTAGDVIEIVDTSNSNAPVGSYTVLSADLTNGLWNGTTKSITVSTLSSGAHALALAYADAALNDAGPGPTTTITIDTTAPTLTSGNAWAGNSTNLSVLIQFSEEIYGNTTGTITLQSSTTSITAPGTWGTTSSTIYSGGTPVSGTNGTNTWYAFDNYLYLYRTDANYTSGNRYDVDITASAFRDAAGNALAVISSTNTSTTQSGIYFNTGSSISIDSNAPTASVTAATIATPSTANAVVQSTETGLAFLVRNSINIAGTTGLDAKLDLLAAAADNQWNVVRIATASSNTNLSTTGLVDGVYNVYALDLAGNLSAASTNTITIDTAAPTVSSVVITGTDSNLAVGEVITVTVNTSEAVTVTGTPTYTIDVGGVSKTASYSSGSGTSALVFRYTIASGDTDTAGGITAGTTALALAGGTLKDAAGNNLSLTTPAVNAGTNSIAVDGTAPTLAITSSASALKAGETASITFTFSEAPTGFTSSDISTSNGAISGLAVTADPKVYTATFTPTASLASGSASITVAAASYTDAAGNNGGAGTTPSISIDTLAPTLAITSSASALKAGETATITFTFSEAPSGFTSSDISTSNGAISGLAVTADPKVYTATFTPTASLASGSASITVAAASYTDAAGNNGGAGTTPSISIDTLAPTLAITSSASALKAGETATITFTFSEDPGSTFTWNGTTGDVVVTGGTLSAISGSGLTRTATFTPTASLASGSASITVAAASYTDAAGNNGGAGTTPSISIDTLRPTIALSSNVSALKAGETATITFTLSEASSDFTSTDVTTTGGTISNFSGSGTSYTATFTPTANSTTSGVISVASSTFADAAGNTNNDGADANNTVTLAVDTLRPTITITDSDPNTVNIADGTVAFTFTFTEPVTGFDTSKVTIGNGTKGTFSAVSSSVYTLVVTPSAFSSGNITVDVSTTGVTDAAGNQATAPAPYTQAFDTAAPNAPAITSVTDDVNPVTGGVANGGSTNDTVLLLTGTAEANSTVTLYNGATNLGTATANGSGAWSFTTATLTNGSSYSFNATATDAAGNVSAASANYVITVDTSAPTAAVAITAVVSDSGSSASDYITNDTSLVVNGSNGSLASGEKVQISSDGSTWADVSVLTATTWTYTDPTTRTSNITYQVRVIDTAGNVGNTASQLVTIDTGAPTSSVGIQSVQLVEAGGIANGTAGTAAATITVTKADALTAASFDAAYLTSNGWSTADSGVTYTKAGTYGTATFTIASGVVAYALSNSATATQALTANQAVSDGFGSIRIVDTAGNTSLSSAIAFAITGSNDAPSITSGATASFAENATGTVYTATASDPDASSTLSYSIAGADANLFTINSGTGAISFRTAPNFEAPADAGADNVYNITVAASDGSLTGASQAVAIQVTNANEFAPVLSKATISLTEGQTQTLTSANFLVSDADTTTSFGFTISDLSGGIIQLSSNRGVAISSFTTAQLNAGLVEFAHDGGEAAPFFRVIASDDPLGDSQPRTSATVAVMATMFGVNDAPVLNSASLSVAEGQTVTLAASDFSVSDPDNTSFTYLLSAISNGFFQLSTAPGTAITSFSTSQLNAGRVQFVHNGQEAAPAFNLTVSDGSASSATAAAAISFSNLNDAPLISAAGSLVVVENAAAAVIDAGISLSDSDSSTLSGASIAITAGLTTGDLLGFASQNGINGSTNAAAGVLTLSGNATVAQYQAALRSVTFRSTSDNPTATSDRRTISWQVNDGAALNNLSAPATSTITITPVNDAPSATGRTITILEDTATALSAADFGFSDGDGNSFNAVIITNLPSAGSLTLQGVAVGENQVIAAAAIPGLVYTPPADANGSNLASIGFRVQDNGGTANGGSDTSATAFLRFDVSPVNDAPVIVSNGGGATAALSLIEATTAITTVAATDRDSTGLTYSIGGGADQSKFAIHSSSGVLTFVAPPSFANPTDAGANNVYDVIVNVSDGSLSASQAIAVTVTDAPALTINQPISGNYLNVLEQTSPLLIAGTSSGLADGTSVTLSVAGISYTTTVSANGWSVSLPALDLQNLSEGTVNLTATASDANGNPARQGTASFIKDTVAPAISINTPISGGYLVASELANPLVIGGTCSGAAEGRPVTVMVGGVTFTTTVQNNNTWSVSLSPAALQALPEGAVSVTADLSDAAGNPASQASAGFTKNTTTPTITVATPISAGYLNTAEALLPLVLSGSVSGADGQTVTVTVGSGSAASILTTTATAGGWSVSVPSSALLALPQGTVAVVAAVSNVAGTAATPATAAFIKDTLAPTITITTPISGDGWINAAESTTPLLISGTSSGASNGRTVTLTLAGVTTTTTVQNNAWSVSVPAATLQALGQGSQTVTADLSDEAGNPAVQASASFSVDTVAPATRPTVNATTLDLGTSSLPLLGGTASLAAGERLWVTVNGATYNVAVSNGTWTLDLAATPAPSPVSGSLGSFRDGLTYPVTATVIDAAGNGSSDTTTNELSVTTLAPPVPTVNAQTISDTSSLPTLTGLATLRAGESLSVTVKASGSSSGATYTNLVPVNGQWTLNLATATPASGSLPRSADPNLTFNAGSYDVVATVTNANGSLSSSDATSGELTVVSNAPLVYGSIALMCTANGAEDSNADGTASAIASSFCITRTKAAGVSVLPAMTLTYSLSGTAQAGVDYFLPTGFDPATGKGTVTFAADAAMATVLLPTVNNSVVNTASRTLIMSLQQPSNYSLASSFGAVATLVDNDVAVTLPTVSIAADVGVNEVIGASSTATLTLQLSQASSSDVEVSWQTLSNPGGSYAAATASANVDYTATSGTAIIRAGRLSTTVAVEIKADSLVENSETFYVNLTAATNATLSSSRSVATVTINDANGTALFDQSASTSPNTIAGDANDNLIYGGSANDTITGAGGNDTLIGGLGADNLSGGTGSDLYRYTSFAESTRGTTSQDLIQDFVAGTDKISLPTTPTGLWNAGNITAASIDAAITSVYADKDRTTTTGVGLQPLQAGEAVLFSMGSTVATRSFYLMVAKGNAPSQADDFFVRISTGVSGLAGGQILSSSPNFFFT